MKLFKESLLNLDLINTMLKDKHLRGYEDAIKNNLEKMVSQYLANKSKEIKNKTRIEKNDSVKDRIPAKDNLSVSIIESLPTWVKNDIENAFLIGTSRKVIQTSNGKKYHIDNPLNDLPGGEWTFFLNSVINTRYPTSGDEAYAHQLRKIHPSPKPPQLTKLIIDFFTKEKEIVLDYFMGVGGSLIGASLGNRRAIGIDLNKKYVDTYIEASQSLKLEPQTTIVGDALKILNDKNTVEKILGKEKVSLILIDPPYGNMMAREKTGEAIKKKSDSSPTPYTNLDTDLGNMELKLFHEIFKNSVESSLKFLKPRGHIVVFIKDLQPKGKELNLLHADLIHSINSIPSLNYLGTRIWADQGVNLYPYGYPYSYVANQIHQYILIFRSTEK